MVSSSIYVVSVKRKENGYGINVMMTSDFYFICGRKKNVYIIFHNEACSFFFIIFLIMINSILKKNNTRVVSLASNIQNITYHNFPTFAITKITATIIIIMKLMKITLIIKITLMMIVIIIRMIMMK